MHCTNCTIAPISREDQRRENLISTFCGTCGAPRRPEDLFCPQCGSAYPDAPGGESEQAAAAPPLPVVDDQPYGGEITLVAVIGTLFIPLISLIIALVVRSGERRESRRSFLKTWAIACVAWMCTGWLVAVLFFLSVSSSIGGGGGCQGGVDPFSLPSYVSQDGTHWTVTRSCYGGGTKSRPATPAENRRLNKGG